MSPERRRQLAFAAALLALAGLTLWVGRRSRQNAPPSPVPAIDNPGPAGLEAAYLYLAQRGQARVLEAPFGQLPSDARVLVSALPYARTVDPDEREALLSWISKGGTLVLLGEHSRNLGGAVTGVADPVSVALHLKDREVGLTELGKDVKALLDDATRAAPEELVAARTALPDPLFADVRALAVSAGRGFEASPGEAVPLAVVGDTPVVLALDHGQGRIVIFAGADALTNARLDLGDNLQLLANLGAHGPVLFDEGHHREAPSVAAASMVRHMGPAVLAALLGGLLLTLAFGRRLGPPQPPLGLPRRGASDYALQLGRLFQRAHAEPALAADLLRGLRQRARERTHLPASADDLEVARRIALEQPSRAERYQAVCQALDRASKGPLAPPRFAALTRDAAELQREL